MAPSEAERLNIEQARFYLANAKTIKAYCQRMNRRLRRQAGLPTKSREELIQDVREHVRQLREYYKGKGKSSTDAAEGQNDGSDSGKSC